MTRYLLFRLYGPMAAWGDVAVGEFRPSHTHPTRTTVLGLIAAAMGITRDQETRLLALDRALQVSARLDASGEVMRDYHTTQVPSAQKKVVHYTRQDELASDSLNTMLSSRDYRCDAAATIAVQSSSDEFPLDTIAETLRKPRLPLYLGRKSCPLALPLDTQLIEKDNLIQALEEYPVTQQVLADLTGRLWGYGQIGAPDTQAVFWEGEQPGLSPDMSYPRRDRLRSRKRWQYDERTEHRSQLPGKEA